MTCTGFLSRLDGMDSSVLPIDMAIHASMCQACSTAASGLLAALEAYRLPDRFTSVDLVPRISALLPFLPAPRRIVAMRDWLLSGLVIVVGMVIVPLLAEFQQLKTAYGLGFTLPLAIVFGLVITAYATLFIASHLEEFGRRVNRKRASSV